MPDSQQPGHVEHTALAEGVAGIPPDLSSCVTDAALDEVLEWQHRALDRMYPIVIFDALRVKIRDADSPMVKNKAVYIALGITWERGARFWASGSPTTKAQSSGCR